MKNVVEFENDKEFRKFISNKILKGIGSGSLADCYLGKDNCCYKVYNNLIPIKIEDVDLIIAEDIDVTSFIFPEEVYIVNGIIKGKKMQRIKGNLVDYTIDVNFDINRMKKLISKISNIKAAKMKIREDVKILTSKKIKIFDLPYNLLFDGEHFYGIDTDDYRRVDLSYEKLYEHNIKCLNKAITTILNAILEILVTEYRLCREDELYEEAANIRILIESYKQELEKINIRFKQKKK